MTTLYFNTQKISCFKKMLFFYFAIFLINGTITCQDKTKFIELKMDAGMQSLRHELSLLKERQKALKEEKERLNFLERRLKIKVDRHNEECSGILVEVEEYEEVQRKCRLKKKHLTRR